MRYWIQRADFSFHEHDSFGATDIARIFRSHPWSDELRLEESRSRAGEETCLPGLGIVPGDGRILHLCPSENELLVHYHFAAENRILGIFRTRRQRVLTTTTTPEKAEELIRRFITQDHEGLLALL